MSLIWGLTSLWDDAKSLQMLLVIDELMMQAIGEFLGPKLGSF
jgi:hypothetical protein